MHENLRWHNAQRQTSRRRRYVPSSIVEELYKQTREKKTVGESGKTQTRFRTGAVLKFQNERLYQGDRSPESNGAAQNAAHACSTWETSTRNKDYS